MEVYDYSKPNFIDYAESESIYLDVDFENSLVQVVSDLEYVNGGTVLEPNGQGEPKIELGITMTPIPKLIPFPLSNKTEWTPGQDIRKFGYFIGDIRYSKDEHSDADGNCNVVLGEILKDEFSDGMLNTIRFNKRGYSNDLIIERCEVVVYHNTDVVYNSSHDVQDDTIYLDEVLVNWTKVKLTALKINKPIHPIIWFVFSDNTITLGSELLFNDEIKSATFDFGDIGEVYQEYYNVIEKKLTLEITDTKGIFNPYSDDYNQDLIRSIESSVITVSLLTDEFPTPIHTEQKLGKWYFHSYSYNYSDSLWTLNYIDNMRDKGTQSKCRSLVGNSVATSELTKVGNMNHYNFFTWLYGSQYSDIIYYNKPIEYTIPYMPFINIRRGILSAQYDELQGENMNNYPYKDTDYLYRVENNPMYLMTSSYGRFGAISQVTLDNKLKMTSFDPYSVGKYNTSIKIPYDSLLSLEVDMLTDTPYDGISTNDVPMLYNSATTWNRTFKPFSGYISKRFGALSKDVLTISNPKDGVHEYTDGSVTPEEVNELLIFKWKSNSAGMNQGTEFFNQLTYKGYDNYESELTLKSIDNEQLPMFLTYFLKPPSVYALCPTTQSAEGMGDTSAWYNVVNIHLPSTLDGDREQWKFNNSIGEPRTQVWDYVSDYVGIDKRNPIDEQTVPLTVKYANEPNLKVFKDSTHKITTEMWYRPNLNVGDTFSIVKGSTEHIYMVTSKTLNWTGSMQMLIEATHLKTV